ncbi:hypothetical protein QJ854_gp282 [Moumouvirus goulette]|uniref:Uncharacterized protein n=1 Tax=Moumouvirus goulette TaxID=1247379 RepID=M1NN80_9VIRU|nr:hypothetical protein QJ854_gp282 [Moumouvirus goulette]AGF85500.1 hypothetical protein glt_00695 [Moumouvirus goulette]
MYFLFFNVLKFIIWIFNYIFDFNQINFRQGKPGLYKFNYSIIGYKRVNRCPNKFYKKGICRKLYSDIILELEIPAGARIIRSNESKYIDELRCDKVIVKEIITTKPYKNFKKDKHTYFSHYDNNFIYKIGEIIEPISFSVNINENNVEGIHFYKKYEDAMICNYL